MIKIGKPIEKVGMLQKVTVEQPKPPSSMMGRGGLRQVTGFKAPPVQKFISRQLTKGITKVVRKQYVKDITKQFTPQKRLIPFGVTRTKVIQKQIQKEKQRLRQVTKLRPAVIQITKRKQIAFPIQRVGLKQLQKQITIPAQVTMPTQALQKRLVMLTPSVPAPVSETPFTPYVPPIIPFLPPILPFGFGRGRKRIIPVRAEYGYTPSYRALVFKIRGPKAKPSFRGRYTGFQMRPIPKGFKWIKVFRRKKR